MKNKTKKYQLGDSIAPQDGIRASIPFMEGITFNAPANTPAKVASIEDIYASISNTNASDVRKYLSLVAEHESFGGEKLESVNKNGTKDLGIFHINERSVKTLGGKARAIYNKAGIEYPEILDDIASGKSTDVNKFPVEIQKALSLANTITVDKNSNLAKTKLDLYNVNDANEAAKAWLNLHNRGKDKEKLIKSFGNSYKRWLDKDDNLELEATGKLFDKVPEFQQGGFLNGILGALGAGQNSAQGLNMLNSTFAAAGSRDPMLQSSMTQAQDFFASKLPADHALNQNPGMSGVAALIGQQLSGTPQYMQTPDLQDFQQKGFYGFKKGGEIPVNANGLHEEKGPVVVPSNNISMKGIKGPVFAMGDGGELTLMMPEEEYIFPESQNVIEIPVYDKGGRVVRMEQVDKAFLGKLIKGIGKGIGKVAGTVSDIAGFAAPFVSKVLPVVGPALGAVGGIGDFFQNGKQGGIGGLLGNALGGAASGFGGFGGGVGGLLGKLQGEIGTEGLRDLGQGIGGILSGPQQAPQYATQGYAGNEGIGAGISGFNFGTQGIAGPMAGLGGIGGLLTQLLGSGGGEQQGSPLSGAIMPLLSILAGGQMFREGGLVHGYHGKTPTTKTGKLSTSYSYKVKDHDYRGGFVPNPTPTPIQTESYKGKDEMIIWPTGHITNVNAKDSHDKMSKNGDSDMVTDFTSEGSYITSVYGGIKLKRTDLEEFEVGMTGSPYSEHSKGEMPKITTAADLLFRKKEKSITPAEATKRLREKFPIKDRNDVFSDFTDELNIANRSPYIEAIVSLSEYEKQKKERESMRRKISYSIEPIVGKELASPLAKKAVGDLEKPTSPLFRYGGVVGKKKVKLPKVTKAQDSILSPLVRGGALNINPLGEITPVQSTSQSSITPDNFQPPAYSQNYGNLKQFASGFSNLLGGINSNAAAPQYNRPNQLLGNIGLGLSGASNLAGSALNFSAGNRFKNQIQSEIPRIQELRQLQGQANMASTGLNALNFLTNTEAPQQAYAPRRQFISPTAAQAGANSQLEDQRGQFLSAIRGGQRGISPSSFAASNANFLRATSDARANLFNQRIAGEQSILDQRNLEDRERVGIDFSNQTNQFNLNRQNTAGLTGALSQGLTNDVQNRFGEFQDVSQRRREAITVPHQFNLAALQGIGNLGGLAQTAQGQINNLSIQDFLAQYQAQLLAANRTQ